MFFFRFIDEPCARVTEARADRVVPPKHHKRQRSAGEMTGSNRQSQFVCHRNIHKETLFLSVNCIRFKSHIRLIK